MMEADPYPSVPQGINSSDSGDAAKSFFLCLLWMISGIPLAFYFFHWRLYTLHYNSESGACGPFATALRTHTCGRSGDHGWTSRHQLLLLAVPLLHQLLLVCGVRHRTCIRTGDEVCRHLTVLLSTRALSVVAQRQWIYARCELQERQSATELLGFNRQVHTLQHIFGLCRSLLAHCCYGCVNVRVLNAGGSHC